MKHKILFPVVIILLAVSPLIMTAAQKTAKGIVFEDINRNGILDKGEPGIPGVVVSNQSEVVQTDKTGYFRLPVSKESIIFVTKPAGYDIPLDKNNLPQFYYIHQPAGSPAGLKYKGIAPTGKLPRTIHFPLIKSNIEDTFDVIVVGDPQTKTREEVNFFRDDIIASMLGTKALFYLALGDIIYDELTLYDYMNPLMEQIGMPAYHVMGNHDMNYRVPDNKYEAETFKRIHGPDYYSFNYGKVHFVVLNTIKYMGWNNKENKPGIYTGHVHARQLTWLKNDLSFVPEDHLVVLSMHIPIESALYKDSYSIVDNRGDLFEILSTRRHLLALSGHMHYFEYLEYTTENGWTGSAQFPAIIAGAGCGTWWHGPRNPMGIPYVLCTDGIPNGYFLFTFNENQFSYRFCPSLSANSGQMRINTPIGTLSQTDAQNREINVNVFTGTPGTIVMFQLNNGPETAMEQKIMKDPFFEKLIKENPDIYKDWMEPTLSSHIWTAPLPQNLGPGIHQLKITAKDHQGNVFTAFRLFEVVQ